MRGQSSDMRAGELWGRLPYDDSPTHPKPADTISVKLKQKWSGGWRTLHTGNTEVYYDNPQTTNHTSHIAVGFDAFDLMTGSYDLT